MTVYDPTNPDALPIAVKESLENVLRKMKAAGDTPLIPTGVDRDLTGAHGGWGLDKDDALTFVPDINAPRG